MGVGAGPVCWLDGGNDGGGGGGGGGGAGELAVVAVGEDATSAVMNKTKRARCIILKGSGMLLLIFLY